jgi:hypothetical protein
MKYKLILFSLIICLLSLGTLSFYGITHNQDSNKLFDTASSETWTVAYYFNDATDNTLFLKDYSFNFSGDGVTIATTDSSKFTGDWFTSEKNKGSYIYDEDFAGISEDQFVMAFNNTNNPLIDGLSKKWNVISFSKNKIELVALFNKTKGVDFLTFYRNEKM